MNYLLANYRDWVVGIRPWRHQIPVPETVEHWLGGNRHPGILGEVVMKDDVLVELEGPDLTVVTEECLTKKMDVCLMVAMDKAVKATHEGP